MAALFLLAGGLLVAALVPVVLDRLPVRLPRGDFWLAFSGAFITTTVLLHLFPEFHFSIKAIPFVVVGFFVQFFMEMWARGIEHGHAAASPLVSGGRLWGLWIGLLVHSVLEGVSLISAGTLQAAAAGEMYLSVLIHKIPAALILYFILKESVASVSRRWGLFLAFAAASPVGMLIGWGMVDTHVQLLWAVGALVVGSFLHIGTSMLSEVGHHHQRSLSSIAAVLVGLLVAWMI